MNVLKSGASLCAILTLTLVTLFSVGCGDTDNFVFTNTNVAANPGQTGNLQFRFDRALAQTVGDVPAGTTQLLFALHSGNPPSQANLVETRLVNYADEVILEDVDPSVNTIVVVALSDEQLPLISLLGFATVIVDTTQPVDLGNAEIITFDALTAAPNLVQLQKDGDSVQVSLTLGFSNGSEVTLTQYDASEVSFTQNVTVANITTTGSFSTGVGGQNTTATATYNLFGTQQSDTIDIQTFCFRSLDQESENLEPGNEPARWAFLYRFVGPNGIVIVTDQENDDPGPFSYAIEPTNVGVSLDAQNRIVVDSGATPGTDFSVIVTFTDPVTGFAVTAPVEFTVEEEPE
jgi:hypothetical protein